VKQENNYGVRTVAFAQFETGRGIAMPNGKSTAVAPIRLASARAAMAVAAQPPARAAITCDVDGRHFTGFTVEAWRNHKLKESNGRKGNVSARQHGLLRIGGRTFFLVLSPGTLASGTPSPAALVPDDEPEDRLDSLTARELQIAHRISDGACDKVIAHTLGISEYTVREHVRRIFSKLGVCKRTAIVRLLWRGYRRRQTRLSGRNSASGH
jgi:DNA-binding CsgD family transcriptional regulator